MRQIILSLMWNLITGTAVAGPAKTLLVRGIEVVRASAQGVEIQAEIECGERLAGVMVREKGSNVGVAIVVERPEVRCSGGSVTRSLNLPFLNAANFDIVTLPAGEVDAKVVMQEAAVVARSQQGLSVQWDHMCRPALGVLMVPRSENALGVAMILSSSRKARGAACEGGRKSMVLSSVKGQQFSWSTEERPGKLENLYAMRVVAPTAVKIQENGEIVVTWQRRCREMPLGALFSGHSRSTVSVVTAYLPNVGCKSAAKVTEVLTVQNLLIQRSKTLSPISTMEADHLSRQGHALRLEAPAKIQFNGPFKQVSAKRPSTCGRDMGTVVGQDHSGNLAMATLIRATDGVCTATSSLATDTLPLRVDGALTPRVFPLRVLGSVAH